jgi:hypothetical protein
VNMSAKGSGGFAVRLPQLRRKTEFYIFEALALVFGASASQVFFVHDLRWQSLAICAAGYAVSFLIMVSIRCTHCREPLGRVNGKWGPFPQALCSKCGRDHG